MSGSNAYQKEQSFQYYLNIFGILQTFIAFIVFGFIGLILWYEWPLETIFDGIMPFIILFSAINTEIIKYLIKKRNESQNKCNKIFF